MIHFLESTDKFYRQVSKLKLAKGSIPGNYIRTYVSQHGLVVRKSNLKQIGTSIVAHSSDRERARRAQAGAQVLIINTI